MVILIWWLKQLQDFILKYSKMGVSVEVHKIIKFTICNTIFFTSGGGNDEVLVTLSLIEQVIKDVSSMCILFSVKCPELF